ncbi:hypothetical protein [Cryobacterium sp. Y11]|jgi:hypothetical protein|uniref:hypothetical protein n=1 Tax=Cryobacterium sp. Y11 TaxID=2045016 RepID=UPI000CE46AA4|nr:hypothetical protein [Cryobacterium sp. Y11]
MDGLDGVWTTTPTDQLPAFRRQRQLILSLIGDVALVQRRLNNVDPSEFWRSSAQRAYRERISEIVHDLSSVLNLLDDAQQQLQLNISQLELGQ